ncbi:RadC family protein [Desulfofustis limnaeus]|jgi:DNA repair protein RadC|uniref:UPF0758 protein n=1 Tax=Desulfofustis limnaeus TaxID=2740163 RepID=A0ABM7WDQ4_9BACT|nr:DNA repair protein RadC [Desulfofustis limnaeus]MDX9895207.1 DNA repair protein RadC [Desulfofustis sp.]BDD89101.1 UPF0758 protein [Desulfofustis limnaeus]
MDKGQWQQRGAGHRQRLRDRFLDQGLAALSDTEILELLLSFGTPRGDCKQQARELLGRFSSLPGVLDAEADDLLQISGVGPKNCFALRFIKAVADRYLQQRMRGRSYLRSSQAVHDYLLHSMRGLPREVFTVIYLDSSLAILDSEVVAEGTVNVNTVYPREIVRRALSRNAAALIVAHNHPSGAVSPSQQDHHLTRTLYLVCNLMQIRLLDHLIIGDRCFSFADNGLMEEICRWYETVNGQL